MTDIVPGADLVEQGVISAHQTAKLAAGIGAAAAMRGLLPLARRFAKPDLSNYFVGAVGQGLSGALYFGANFEFAGTPLNQTVHAEQAVLVNAACHGETGLQRLAVSAAPCGHCRQFLNELNGAADLQIHIADNPVMALAALLPHAFGPQNLNHAGGLLSAQDHQLQWADAEPPTSPGATAALEMAHKAYAPYSGAVAAAAVTTRQDSIHTAPYLENVAFNPSLSPLQGALVVTALAGTDWSDIALIEIVKIHNSTIDHAAAARALVPFLPTSATVRVYNCVAV